MFSKIFKISVSSRFNWSSRFFDQSKREEENSVFNLKSRVSSIPSQFLSISRAYFHVHFDSFPIPLDWSNFKILKHIGIRSDFLNYSLSFSPIPLSIPSHNFFFFFVIFLVKDSTGFLQKLKVRPLWPSFFIKLHDFMHFSCIF